MLRSTDVYIDWQLLAVSFLKILVRVCSSYFCHFLARMGGRVCSKRQKNKMDDLYYFSCTSWTFNGLPDVGICFNGWSILVVGFLHPYYFDIPFYLRAALDQTEIPANWKTPQQTCSFKKALIWDCKHWRSSSWDWSLALKYKTNWPLRTIQHWTYRSWRTDYRSLQLLETSLLHYR